MSPGVASIGEGGEFLGDPNTQRIHVWYIYLHLGDIYGKCR